MTTILFIEDEKMLRDEVAEWLMFEGYEVLTAADGVEGANLAMMHQPDLIICDIMMPNMDGYGVMLHVRANSLTQLTPFIFTTAKASHDDIRYGMTMGADDYITKPYFRDELLAAVSRQLEKKEAQHAARTEEVESWKIAFEHEHQLRLLKAKMIAMFSQDFRTPLTTIMASISIVRDYADRLDDASRRKHLDRAEALTHELMQMLDDLFFLAQMDANTLNFKLEPVYVGHFIGQLVDELQAGYGETHTLKYHNRFSDLIMTDPRLLRQITSNLISNAIKFSPPGSSVEITIENRGGRNYALSVQDKGIGIPPEDQQRLFSAFERGSNVKDKPGAGLGLAIVQAAVDLLEGSVHLDSHPGIGTTMTVVLPIIHFKMK